MKLPALASLKTSAETELTKFWKILLGGNIHLLSNLLKTCFLPLEYSRTLRQNEFIISQLFYEEKWRSVHSDPLVTDMW